MSGENYVDECRDEIDAEDDLDNEDWAITLIEKKSTL